MPWVFNPEYMKKKVLNWYVSVNYKYVMFTGYIPNMKANV